MTRRRNIQATTLVDTWTALKSLRYPNLRLSNTRKKHT